MPWVRLDDKFHSNPKVLEAGNAAAGVYVRSLSYCASELTDGFVPASWARVSSTKRERDTLERVGLWLKIDRGWVIPDFLDYNPSREKVLEERKRVAERVAAHRERKRNTPGNDDVTRYTEGYMTSEGPFGNAVSNGNVTPPPTRPVPQPESLDQRSSSKDQSSSLYPANSENDFNMISDLRESDLAGDSPFAPDLLKDAP